MEQLGQGGSAIRAALAALSCTLLLLVGVTPAYAGPSLRLVESEARAGQVVHFSISDVDEEETYVIQLGDHALAAGSGTESEQVSGQFPMVDLGGGERKVTVEAEIRDGDERKTVKRKLRYLGRPSAAPAVADTPPATSAPAPAAVLPAAPAPQPVQPLTTAGVPVSEPAAITRPRSRRGPPRQAQKKHKRVRRQSRSNRAGRRTIDSAAKRAKRKRAKAKRGRERARTAPLFDGVPERGSGGSGPGGSEAGTGLNDGNTIAPPAALTVGRADVDGGGPAAAILVPALLGLAALALTGTVLMRRRRAR